MNGLWEWYRCLTTLRKSANIWPRALIFRYVTQFNITWTDQHERCNDKAFFSVFDVLSFFFYSSMLSEQSSLVNMTFFLYSSFSDWITFISISFSILIGKIAHDHIFSTLVRDEKSCREDQHDSSRRIIRIMLQFHDKKFIEFDFVLLIFSLANFHSETKNNFLCFVLKGKKNFRLTVNKSP